MSSDLQKRIAELELLLAKKNDPFGGEPVKLMKSSGKIRVRHKTQIDLNGLQAVMLAAGHRRLAVGRPDEQEVGIPECQGTVEDEVGPAKCVDASSQLDLQRGKEPDKILDQQRKSNGPPSFNGGGLPAEPHERGKAQDGSSYKPGDPDRCVVHRQAVQLEDKCRQERARQTKEDGDGKIGREEVA